MFNNEILEDWKKINNNLDEAFAHSQALWSLIRSRSIPEVGEDNAKKNVVVMNRYKIFFQVIENCLGYAVVLSINHLFDLPSRRRSGKPISIPLFLNKLNDQKRTGEFRTLQKKFRKTINQFHEARDKFFAHRIINSTEIPGFDDTKSLIISLREFLNTIGQNFTPQQFFMRFNETDSSEESFERLINDLRRE